MIYLSNIKELDKIIGDELATQCSVNADMVRTADSVYGTDLDKRSPNTNIFNSIEHTDTLVLFEISPDEATGDMSEENRKSEFGHFDYYKHFIAHVIVYGDTSIDTSLIAIARLRSEAVRSNLLLTKGVHISKVTEPDKIEEFVNGALWMRNDFDIHFGVVLDVAPATPDYMMEDYTELNIRH